MEGKGPCGKDRASAKKSNGTSGSSCKAEESAKAALGSGNDDTSQRFCNLGVVLDLRLTFFLFSFFASISHWVKIKFFVFNHRDILIRNLLPPFLSSLLVNSVESGTEGTLDTSNKNNDQQVSYIKYLCMPMSRGGTRHLKVGGQNFKI